MAAKKKEVKTQADVAPSTSQEELDQARAGHPDSEQQGVQNFVEAQDAEGAPVRAVATPTDKPLYDVGQPDDVAGLEPPIQHGEDPLISTRRKELESYPRPLAEFFDPHGEDKREKLPLGARGTTGQSLNGRLVALEEDVDIGDGEIVKKGMVDLPVGIADALIDAGVAFEPAGKGRGR